MSDIDHNNQVSKISLKEVAAAIKAAGHGTAAVNVSVTKVGCSTEGMDPWGGEALHDGLTDDPSSTSRIRSR